MCRNYKIDKIELINKYGKQIFIEPYLLVTTEQKNNNNLDISVVLHDILKTIMVQRQLYNIPEIINLIPSTSKKLHDIMYRIFREMQPTNRKSEV